MKMKVTSEGPQCYKCKGYGHYDVVCPTRDKKLAYICEKELLVVQADDDKESEESNEDNSDEEEHLIASNLPSCVIKRVFSGLKKEIHVNPEWLRTNIFHTRMEHNG